MDPKKCGRCGRLTLEPEQCSRCGTDLCFACWDAFEICPDHAGTDPASSAASGDVSDFDAAE
jgi:hypothetical protein